MMLTETVLIAAGSAAAAIVIGISAYVGISRRSNASSKHMEESAKIDSSPSFSTQAQNSNAPSFATHRSPKVTEKPSSSSSSTKPQATFSSVVASAPVQEEAPAPFSEDIVSTPGTSAPTDVTALANMASPIDATTGVLVIPTPKRRTRAKRLPTDGSVPPPTRRRRSTRNKPIAVVVAPESSATAIVPESQHAVAVSETQSAVGQQSTNQA